MQAQAGAPAERRDVFDILELLESVPGVFSDILLPQLEPRHKAALALTCAVLREAVQHSARALTLRAGGCCLSRAHQLGQHLPNIRSVCVRPGNLHEAMFVLPLLFMQSARDMTALTSLQLHDQLPDRPPEEVQCGSCTAWASTYDLSAILATAAHCMPRLASLRFTTHYISDAECAAISLMTGLTALELRSTHGTHMGGLARLTSLRALAHLSLSDREYSMRASHQDVAMLLGCSSLTHLSLGPHTMTHPLISCLAEMHSPAWTAAIPAGRPSQQQQHHYQQQQAVAVSGARAGPPGVCESLAADCVADRAFALQPTREVPPPPPLASLRLVLQPSAHVDRTVSNLGCLTGLTRLALGWIPAAHGQVGGLAPGVSSDAMSALGQLSQLCELALGWAADPPALAAVADVSSLTSLQLGGLFSALRVPRLVGELRLPQVRRLAAHMEIHPSLLGPLNPRDPLERSSCVSALAAFPGLTRLELTGRLYGPALADLPLVLPREGLRELLLPQRLDAQGRSLSALMQLRALTHLRLGWRSVYHAGPASYRPAVPGPYGSVPSMRDLADTSTPAPRWGPQCEVIVLDDDAPPTEEWHEPEPEGPAAGNHVAAAAAAAGGRGQPACRSNLIGRKRASGAAAAAAAGTSSSSAAAAAAAAAAAVAPPPCRVCQADASRGCLCRLQVLEVVGPLPPAELQWLTQLPALRTLVLRDNPSWSSGLTLKHLADLSLHLTALQLYRCEGASAHALEHMCLAEARRLSAPGVDGAGAAAGAEDAAQGEHPSINTCHVCNISEVPRGGVTAGELGRGHQYMGVCLTACEEWGLLHGEASGPCSSEVLPPEPPAPGAPPAPQPFAAMLMQAGNGQHGIQLLHIPAMGQAAQGGALPGHAAAGIHAAMHAAIVQQGQGQQGQAGIQIVIHHPGQQQQQAHGQGQAQQPGGPQLLPHWLAHHVQHQQHMHQQQQIAAQQLLHLHAQAQQQQQQQQAQGGPGGQGVAGGVAGPDLEVIELMDSDSDEPDVVL